MVFIGSKPSFSQEKDGFLEIFPFNNHLLLEKRMVFDGFLSNHHSKNALLLEKKNGFWKPFQSKTTWF